MPISFIKRKIRRVSRRVRNWSTIASLTLKGNRVGKNTRLANAKHPILMIYGFGSSRRTMAILETRLRQDGHVTFSLNLGGFIGTFNTVSIEESARYIDKKVEEFYKKYNIQGKLNLVGHSKGGLIGSYWIKFLNGARRVNTLVTLGAPYNGTPWGYFSYIPGVSLVLKSLKQLKPNSIFLQRLRETPYPKRVKVFSVYSKDDNACPFPASVLEEADNVKNIEIPSATHSELLVKKTVFNIIRHALKNEMPESLIDATRKNIVEFFGTREI
ncbi:MAG: PGAP1 family protein [uncultured bacterium]|nr:MAG: PGAP1 family protein [uncultured bacterium]HLD43814.1 alpha/beta hydrolase [bacterium]